MYELSVITLLPTSLLQTNDKQILKERAKALDLRCSGQNDITSSLVYSEMLF